MAKHSLILFVICFTMWAVFGSANGTGNAKGNEYLTETQVLPEQLKDFEKFPKESTIKTVDAPDGPSSDQSLQVHQSLSEARNIVKRAPNGFTGVRGKKDFDNDPFDEGYNMALLGHSMELDNDGGASELFYNERLKKTPNAFYGVRGKKRYFDYGNDFQRLEYILYKLEEERIREEFLKDLLNDLSATTMTATSSIEPNEIAKRTPIGFTGVRGKRPSTYNNFYEDLNELEKRAPGNAFVGVRGKKDDDHQNFKRSPATPFDLRGKKQRFLEFSNKFVAVRGKKNSLGLLGRTGPNVNELSNELETDGERIVADRPGITGQSPLQGRYFFNMWPLAQLYDLNGKRNSNVFFGLRGKRQTNTDSTDRNTSKNMLPAAAEKKYSF